MEELIKDKAKKGKVLLLIDGHSGAGKTWLSQLLVKLYSDQAQLVNFDDYRDQEDCGAHDWELICKILQTSLSESNNQLIIAEGNGSRRLPHGYQNSLYVMVYADHQTRRNNLSKRIYEPGMPVKYLDYLVTGLMGYECSVAFDKFDLVDAHPVPQVPLSQQPVGQHRPFDDGGNRTFDAQ